MLLADVWCFVANECFFSAVLGWNYWKYSVSVVHYSAARWMHHSPFRTNIDQRIYDRHFELSINWRIYDCHFELRINQQVPGRYSEFKYESANLWSRFYLSIIHQISDSHFDWNNLLTHFLTMHPPLCLNFIFHSDLLIRWNLVSSEEFHAPED